MKNDQISNQIIDFASNSGGALSAVATALILPGADGALLAALAGPAVTEIFKKGINEIRDRITGERGKIRAIYGAAYAFDRINQRLENGKNLRHDGFFSETNGRISAAEVLEGVMIKCRDAYEERKARHIGHIFVTLAFDDNYSEQDGGFLLNLAESLSYRQLQLLRIFYDKHAFDMNSNGNSFLLRKTDYSRLVIGGELFTILAEILNLVSIGLLEYKKERTFEQLGGLNPTDLKPNSIEISSLGRRVSYALNVRLIPTEELEFIEKRLGKHKNET